MHFTKMGAPILESDSDVLFIKIDEMDGGKESLQVNMPEWLSRQPLKSEAE